jgi:outer membrane protein OmpA-like peptidoglycan-associated protein
MFALAGVPVLCAACAAAGPSKELKTARDAYAKLSQSDAAQVNPEGIREAKEALDAAEEAHRDDAGSEQERSAAYIAMRKADIATAQASESRAREDREKADQAYQAQLEQQLASTQQQLNAQKAATDKANKELVGWRKKGEDLVITVSGVSFETGGSELTPESKKRLDAVIGAVKQNPGRTITIAGFTDSKGSENTNLALSQKRADAVKAYLENQGATTSSIFAVGRGETSPVASNETAEGRAENRRVEITMHRAGEVTERQPVKGTDTEPMNKRPPK